MFAEIIRVVESSLYPVIAINLQRILVPKPMPTYDPRFGLFHFDV